MKLDFLGRVCEHEHFIPLNLLFRRKGERGRGEGGGGERGVSDIRVRTLERCEKPYNLVGTLQRCGNLTTPWEPYNVVGTLQRCGNLTML